MAFRYPFDIQSTLEPWRHELGHSFDDVVAHLSDRDRALEDYVDRATPAGAISLWFGASTAVPPGWAICDGTNGTPDLRGKVPVGVHTTETEFATLGQTGGEKTHLLVENEIPSHNHPGSGFAVNVSVGASNTVAGLNGSSNGWITGQRGGSQAHNNLQPYLALHFIMWLGH